MSDPARRPRDLALLDAIDTFRRQPFRQPVWRVARDGRDPLAMHPSVSRWCDGGFGVLYTAQDRDGAIAEIHALLSMQPVFPSQIRWRIYRLEVSARRTLRFADLPTLEKLGVDTARYGERDYSRTQRIADAAHFLGFDGLVAPSARWPCLNAVLFAADSVTVAIAGTEARPVNWQTWRKNAGR